MILSGLAFGDEVVRVELIGADLKSDTLAYREFYRGDEEEDQELHDCAYAGAADAEGGLGVRIAVYGNHKVQTFDVYKPSANAEGCTPFETSKESLKAAKGYMQSLRIDTKKPPAAVTLNDKGDFALSAGTLGFHPAPEDPHTVEFNARSIDEEAIANEVTWNGTPFMRAYNVKSVTDIGGAKYFESPQFALSDGTQVAVVGTAGSSHMRGGSESKVTVAFYDFKTPIKLRETGKPDLPKLGPKVLDKLVVLGLNPETNAVAFREIAHHEPWEGREAGASLNCKYQGQGDFPKSSVILKTLQFDQGDETTDFTIYAAAAELDGCTTGPEASLGLTKAKEHFTKQGIDIANPPAAVLREGPVFVLNKPGGETFEVDMDEVHGSDEAYVIGDKVVFVADNHIVAILETK